MAGKTGTAQKNYIAKDPEKLQYISSFAGYFPAEDPEYSCIVVIHEPDREVGIYGADVAGPVFKSLAEKVHITSPVVDKVVPEHPKKEKVEEAFDSYYGIAQKEHHTLPNLKGMCGMDAIAILENLGIQVEVQGNGKVKQQSVEAGTKINQVHKIVLRLS